MWNLRGTDQAKEGSWHRALWHYPPGRGAYLRSSPDVCLRPPRYLCLRGYVTTYITDDYNNDDDEDDEENEGEDSNVDNKSKAELFL